MRRQLRTGQLGPSFPGPQGPGGEPAADFRNRAAVAGQAGPALRAMAVLVAVAAVTTALGAWRITRGWALSTHL
jgi:hypothetical protein